MAVIPNGIPVRLVAVFGDGDLPEGAVEVGTFDLPVTVTIPDGQQGTGKVCCEVIPDTSAFQRIADALDAPSRDVRISVGSLSEINLQSMDAHQRQMMRRGRGL